MTRQKGKIDYLVCLSHNLQFNLFQFAADTSLTSCVIFRFQPSSEDAKFCWSDFFRDAATQVSYHFAFGCRVSVHAEDSWPLL